MRMTRTFFCYSLIHGQGNQNTCACSLKKTPVPAGRGYFSQGIRSRRLQVPLILSLVARSDTYSEKSLSMGKFSRKRVVTCIMFLNNRVLDCHYGWVLQLHSETISFTFVTRTALVSLDRNGRSKCEQISLSILTLKVGSFASLTNVHRS